MNKTFFIIMIFSFFIYSSDKKKPDYIQLSKDRLDQQLHSSSLKFGLPAFLRIFKEEEVIEVWLKSENKWKIFKSYKICAVSGELGPKEREGDKQAPEGIYYINRKSFNPNSKYHLSIDIGYPNSYDKLLHHTGGAIVIHGYCASIGCFAINNDAIEELYGLLLAALDNQQDQISVHIFPFNLTSAALQNHMGQKEDRDWIIFNEMTKTKSNFKISNQYKYDKYFDFWSNLKSVYEYFEKYNQIPNVNAEINGYKITDYPIKK